MYPVPLRKPPRREGSGLLLLAQVILAVFRVFLRLQETFSSGRKRQKAHAFRQKMDAMRRDQDAMLEKTKNAQGWDRFDAMDDFVAKYGDETDQERHQESRRHLQAIRQESEALQAIHRAAGEDVNQAIRGYRGYIEQHPDSHRAYSYLGGHLQKAGDLDGSLMAYREALRLAGDEPLGSSMSRWHMGMVLKEKGDTEGALSEWRQVIEAGTYRTEVCVSQTYLSMGDLLSEQGDLTGARTAWSQAARWDRTGILAREARKRLAGKG